MKKIVLCIALVACNNQPPKEVDQLQFLQNDKQYTVYDSYYCKLVYANGAEVKSNRDRFKYPLHDNQKTWMVDPNDVPYTVPTTSAQEALDKGYRWAGIDCRPQ